LQKNAHRSIGHFGVIASDLLEIGPEWRRLRWPRGLDAGAETGPEAVNLGAWGGESGRGPARVEKIPGAGEARAAGFQECSFSESGRSQINDERPSCGLASF